jgi:hypothetical protein
MNDRYPHVRFLIDAAPVLAGALALLFLLGSTLRACHHGGASGFWSFLGALVVSVIIYVAVRARIEAFQVMLDVESELRDLARARQESTAPAEPPKV